MTTPSHHIIAPTTPTNIPRTTPTPTRTDAAPPGKLGLGFALVSPVCVAGAEIVVWSIRVVLAGALVDGRLSIVTCETLDADIFPDAVGMILLEFCPGSVNSGSGKPSFEQETTIEQILRLCELGLGCVLRLADTQQTLEVARLEQFRAAQRGLACL
ncbi:hypothetical protein MKEN_00049400 [Mycena kentingensis (nom. inval.)]|nr:hypothetical protein MKEN_00049400 [Mycena kentingensis (nom. inval.)]